MTADEGRPGSEAGESPGPHRRRASRWLYVRVMLVQLLTLLALWLLQATFGGG